jgi:hypothetical protein
MQLAVAGLLVGRSAGNRPIQKPDCLKGTDRASHPVFRQAQIWTIRERPPVKREGIDDPAGCGVVPRHEDGQGIGGLAVLEGRQSSRQPLMSVTRQTIRPLPL